MTDSNEENKKKMVKRTCTKGYVHCKIHRRLGDDENRAIVIRGLKVPQRHSLASLSAIFVANNARSLGLKIK